MASAAISSFLLPHPATLCPPPLHFQKRARRTTIRRRMLRKPTHHTSHPAHGPLDDIIAEIKNDILESPPDCTAYSSLLDWTNPLKAPPTWAVTPLPVSRAPRDQPLNIRKNRNSRSSTSGSSTGEQMSSSRNNSQEAGAAPWPSLDVAVPHCSSGPSLASNSTSFDEHASAQRVLENTFDRADRSGENGRPRRASRLRLFTNGFPRLRRTGTGETSASTDGTSDFTLPSATTASPVEYERSQFHLDASEPSDEAVDAYMRRNAHNCNRLREIMERMARRLPTPVENENELPDDQPPEAGLMPTTLRPTVRMFPEIKLVTEDSQEFSVAIEIEGVLHSRVTRQVPTIDVVFVVDNAICARGTQTWQPARPNPSMSDVLLSIAKSVESQELKKGRTHMILLSPAAYVLHDISKAFPDLYIHRINPAALPYRGDPESQDTVCYENCCKNVFVSNWNTYQSVPGRVKQILKNARLKSPVGELTDVSIDLRVRHGCEMIEVFGSKDVPHLRLGQVHTLFARIRVNKNQTQGVDLDSVNPIFQSSLDVKGLRQDLQNAVSLGAIKVHLLDVQLYHRNSIHKIDCWNYTEAPLVITRELGGLAVPIDTAVETYKRLYFHKFVQLSTNEAKMEADNLLAVLDVNNDLARQVVERMRREITCQSEARQYERDFRQKLPLCPGPVELEAPHEWLLELWSKRRGKRTGIAESQPA
ncbi:hypothetical protein BDU57DRAFT_565985 [Ampelomyces quisqualis]|uniref:Uncharacterized protein n=1 Tax=Ampelomyces quisqualis TaxID=50730 RepID=A0A6A5QA41_AMPQU|nr:hypothetical protein BDU57DRAFT_565985 [Ampelomyces quisqualis]